jgi:hypothetical protein
MTEAATHIRRLFLDPKDTYPDVEAAEILGMEFVDLKNRIESGELEGVRNCCGMTVSRKELISFAMDFWPQAAIEQALGDDLPNAIPKLLRLADLHVRIPRFEIVALECLAERTASPSMPYSRANCSTLCPQNRISSPRRSPASPPRFGDLGNSRYCRYD